MAVMLKTKGVISCYNRIIIAREKQRCIVVTNVSGIQNYKAFL